MNKLGNCLTIMTTRGCRPVARWMGWLLSHRPALLWAMVD